MTYRRKLGKVRNNMRTDKPIENRTEDADQSMESHYLEEGLDVYPLREPSEDPRWALRTVTTWVFLAVFLLLFIVTLLILGLWFD